MYTIAFTVLQRLIETPLNQKNGYSKMKLNKLLICLAVFAPSYATSATQSEGDTVYMCMKNGGSCKATVIRVGSDKIHIEWLETCKVPGSLFGIGDLHKGDTLWVHYSNAKSSSRRC